MGENGTPEVLNGGHLFNLATKLITMHGNSAHSFSYVQLLCGCNGPIEQVLKLILKPLPMY